MRQHVKNQRSSIGLKWTTIGQVREIVENPEKALLVVRYLSEEVIC